MPRKLKGNGPIAPLENSPFGVEVAERVATAANKILAKGPLTAQALVEFSRNPKSITHKDVFDRGVDAAAEAYFVSRAAQLLGCVYEVSVKSSKPARSFHSVVSIASDGEVMRSYRPLGEVLNDVSMLGQLSLDSYRRLVAEIDKIEGLGLDRDPAWKQIISTIRKSIPLAAR